MLFRIDYTILSIFRDKKAISIDSSISEDDIEKEITKKSEDMERFALYRTVLSRLHYLEKEKLIDKGMKLEKSKIRKYQVETWYITEKGIDLLNELEMENISYEILSNE